MVFDLVRLLTSRGAEGPGRRAARPGEDGDRRQAAGDAAARLRGPRRRRRQRRQGLGPRREIHVGAPGPRERDAADPRSGPAGAHCIPRSRAAEGLPKDLAVAGRGRQGGDGPLCPHRAARQETDSDAGRSRSLQRRPEHRPPGQGDAEQHGVYGGDACRAIDGNTSGNFGDGGQTHTQENIDNPWWEVDLGSEHRHRLNRDLQPHGRRPRQAARRLHAQGAGRRPQDGRLRKERASRAPAAKVASTRSAAIRRQQPSATRR